MNRLKINSSNYLYLKIDTLMEYKNVYSFSEGKYF